MIHKEHIQLMIDSDQWEWLPGMLTLDTWDSQTAEIVTCRMQDDGCWLATPTKGPPKDIVYDYDALPLSPLPNLDDPATLGCLHALVERLYAKQIHVVFAASRWAVWVHHTDSSSTRISFGKTKAEALVRAFLYYE